MADVTVTHDPDRQRYVASLDGQPVGHSEYRLSEGVITFTHTEVADAAEGNGVGSVLARHALDDVRATGERSVDPQCPFVAGWIERHPEYADLLVDR